MTINCGIYPMVLLFHGKTGSYSCFGTCIRDSTTFTVWTNVYSDNATITWNDNYIDIYFSNGTFTVNSGYYAILGT